MSMESVVYTPYGMIRVSNVRPKLPADRAFGPDLREAGLSGLAFCFHACFFPDPTSIVT